MRNLCSNILLIILTFCISSSVYSQSQHINQSRGFDANGVYSTKDIDNINLFNGALTLTIPIGGSYKVGGNFSYSLTLVYNSNLWNQEEQCTIQTSGKYTIWYHYDIETGAVKWVDPPYPNGNDGEIITPRQGDDCYTISVPNPETNAGMGWQLTLGKLFPPRANNYSPLATEKQNWVYVAPDGSEHSFYEKLHETDNESDNTVLYTRDGTYLRMKVVGSSERIIEFPNGDVHHFTLKSGTSNNWRLSKMRDQFGNHANVTYEHKDANNVEDWVIKDNFNREQIIYFFTPSLAFSPVVDKVKLTGFGGAQAFYDFKYDIKEIKRAAPHVASEELPAKIIVPFLTTVEFPDASKYEMPLSTSYDTTDTGIYSSLRSIGIIRGLTLPTGGRIEWDYKEYIDNPQTPQDETKLRYGYPIMSSSRAYKRGSTGVRRRRVIEGGNTYVWTYDPMPEAGPAPDDTNCPFNTFDPMCMPKEFVNKVTTPEGHYTLHYFSAYPAPPLSQQGRSITDWHFAEYGLPITKHENQAGQPDKRKSDNTGKPLFLSELVYRKKGDNIYDLERSTYLRYETDALPVHDGYGNVTDNNRRVVARRVIYNDDSNKYVEFQHSGFDGLGHYRHTTSTDNFDVGNDTAESTYFNLSNCNFLINPVTNAPDPSVHCYQEFPTSKPWVLGNYTAIIKQEAGEFSTTGFYFDDFGQLLRKRIFKVTAAVSERDKNDIVIKYSYDSSGNLETEEVFGGDKQILDTTQTLATMPLPATSEYTIIHTYQYGVLSKSQQAGIPFKLVDLDIDPSTGIVMVSRDQSGDSVTYFHDAMGRVTDITPRQGSKTKIIYEPFNGTALAKVTVQHKTNNGVSLLDEEKYIYDHLGRLSSEQQKMPGGEFIERVTKYNGSGLKASISEWGNTAKKTSFDVYDPFGRAEKITPPDHNSPDNHIIWITYKGIREITKTVKMATTAGGETDVDTTEVYDRQGRLSTVEEYSNYSNPNLPQTVKTFYKYDIGNRLKQVSTTAVGVTQNRFFKYDGRGFLNSEQHPELGTFGSGIVQYSGYDTRGNVGYKADGSNQLKYFYDAAGRIERIEEFCGTPNRPCVSATKTWQPLKEYTYWEDNFGTYKLGKLKSATRHNYIINPNSGAAVDVTFTESYDYWGIDGRLSHRQTASSLGTFFQQLFSYHQTGELAWQSYPKCIGNNFCAQSGVSPAREIFYTHTNGLLTKVSSEQNNYAKEITYNGNGTIKQIKHGISGNLTADGVVDTYVMDPDALPRVNQIYTSGVLAGANFNTGTYKYDGSGNIKNIGTDWFIYDRVGRLTEGTSIATWKKKQKFTYDSFGNMTKKETYGNVTDPTTPGNLLTTDLYGTNPATNRFNSIAYDASGNLTAGIYVYDSLNMMKNAPGKIYLYNASDERIQIYDYSAGNPAYNRDSIFLRGLNNEVLREYTIYGGNTSPNNWEWGKDYIYAGTKLLSAETRWEGRLNYHLDHLGSPRLITNNSMGAVKSNQYLPFGETSSGVNTAGVDFTGHEKDVPSSLGGHVLLYMHARFYSAYNGKFLSVDPGRDWNPRQPQSWNMYAYVRNNPVNLIDMTGKCAAPAGMKSGQYGVCIETFIAAKSVGIPFLMEAKGNNRTFSSNKMLTAKTRHTFIADPKTGSILNSKPYVSTSEVRFLPEKQGSGEPTAKVTSASDGNMKIYASMDAYNGYAFYPGAPSNSISYRYGISFSNNGVVGLYGGQHDGYPSHALYIYDSKGNVIFSYEFHETTIRELASPMEVHVSKQYSEK